MSIPYCSLCDAGHLPCIASEHEKLIAPSELPTLVLDALRYRFLRESAQARSLQMDGTAHWHIPSFLLAHYRGRSLDDVIDQARADEAQRRAAASA